MAKSQDISYQQMYGNKPWNVKNTSKRFADHNFHFDRCGSLLKRHTNSTNPLTVSCSSRRGIDLGNYCTDAEDDDSRGLSISSTPLSCHYLAKLALIIMCVSDCPLAIIIVNQALYILRGRNCELYEPVLHRAPAYGEEGGDTNRWQLQISFNVDTFDIYYHTFSLCA